MQTESEQPLGGVQDSPVEESPKKKSVVGKFKDKARKLKTKMKKPKSPGAAENNDTSSSSGEEEESGSDQYQQIGNQPGDKRDVEVPSGLKSDPYESAPYPQSRGGVAPPTAGVEEKFGNVKSDPYEASKFGNVKSDPYEASPYTQVRGGAPPPTAGVEEKFGNLHMGDSDRSQQAFPSAPVDERKTVEGKDLFSSSQEPTPSERDKPLKDHVAEGAAATAATGAAAMGVHSLTEGDSGEREGQVPSEKKTMLEQAQERIFGSTKKDGTPLAAGDSNVPTPSITERAVGLKDTVAAKLGYGGVNQGLTGGAEKGPVNAEGVVNKQPGDSTVEQKPYTQRAYDAAIGAKDSVAEKFGYGGAASTTTPTPASTTTPTPEGEQKTYVQKAQEAAFGAKDAVAAKLGYAGDGANVPASPGERFHPGEEDVALSQLITDKMSTGATTVKDTVMRSFGGKSGPPTPTTTPPPSTAQAVASDPAHTTVPRAEGDGENPGMFGKMSGAVTSLLGTSGPGKNVDESAPIVTGSVPASKFPKAVE